MIRLIDTHSHIFAEAFSDEQVELLERAKESNVERILVVTTSIEEAKKALVFAKEHKGIDVACGFHPTELFDCNEKEYLELKELCKDPLLVAIGEIGLDYYWKEVPHEVQKEWFIKQLELANAVQKPVIIHMRDATKDTLEILSSYGKSGGIMHCYTGSVESARAILKMGYYISLAGPLTFKNANHLLDVAKEVPLERLFVETDAPYLTPHPNRGKRNEPAYVRFTFEKLCELKEVSQEYASEIIWNNYDTLFQKENKHENL